MVSELRGATAIVGVAESDLGEVAPGTTPADLMGQASIRALADAGLTVSDVDGLFAAGTQMMMGSLSLGEYLGINARYSDGTNTGGSSFEAHLHHAEAAIAAGLCDVALIAYGSTQRSLLRSGGTIPQEQPNPYEEPYAPMMPISAYALAASRHMHQFGTTREDLATVAVAAREWAVMNPKAWSRKPTTVEEILAAPMISDPLSVKDCCLLTDGGGAIVVTSAERARDLAKEPVYVLGSGEAQSHLHISSMPDFTVTSAVQSGQRAFEAAGLTVEDVDVVELYDAFTINTLLFLEDLGFCKKGEAGRFVREVGIGPKGGLPVNTNGGGLSYCHPGMYGLLLLVEAVRQIRGESGDRQVADCDVALVNGNGGFLSSQCTTILGSAATL
ncbi:acetyl-CoA acetyltransferase [Rhodococcus opacus]|uniref:acetyl-CoA acetyltransferase n=1 Tax=Rhodococcus opacus TaxID=37919 RepID=UPI001C44364E|nr:acetyl-CoA acetyltransferase [Rhodococcus opacus]MBV6760234.1 thiolase [Rhodococcus opacus]